MPAHLDQVSRVAATHRPCRGERGGVRRLPSQPLVRLFSILLFLLLPLAAVAQSTDSDFDGVPDVADNCVLVANPDQHDDDQDLYGDVCDPDLNNDGTTDAADIAEFKRLMGTGDLEPDLNGDGQVDYRDLGVLNASLGQAPGPRGVTAGEIDPAFVFDTPNVVPVVEEMDDAPYDAGPRPVARLQELNGSGLHFDFVANEIFLSTHDPAEAQDLANRWNGQVLDQLDVGLQLGTGAPSTYLIQVDPSGADTTELGAKLSELDPRIHGGYMVSSPAAEELMALVLAERLNGLEVSLNSLLPSTGIAERTTVEAAATMGGASQPGGDPYTRNAFEWTMMEVDPDVPGDGLFPVDTRAAEAWRIMDAAGVLGNRSRALVLDGGFWPNADFPPFTPVGPLRVPNTDPSGCGSGAPAAFGTPCEAHGTHVVESGFGLPDNGFGTAGPGGPVTDLTVLVSPAIDVASIVHYVLRGVPTALSSRPDVVNISAGFDIPAGFCALACPPLDLLTRELTNAGILIVAAAGNQNRSVDLEDNFCIFGACIPFESSTYAPCELDDVLCVGATEYDNSNKASYSNWGTKNDANSVDLFAPGDVWSVDARSADALAASPNDDLQIISGTSFATPFVSGVATLVNSAQPGLNGRQIRQCIMTSAHDPGANPLVRKRINALDAVRCARGGRSHPFVRISAPLVGASFQEGLEAVTIHAEADDAEDGDALTIRWYSSLDGELPVTTTPGVGASLGTALLSRGSHTLTARVTDSTGLSASDTVNVTVTNPLPILNIVSPSPGDDFYAGQTISLFGTSADPNETPLFGPLGDGQVSWRIDGSFIGTGHDRDYVVSGLSVGSHDICFYGTDDDGEAGVPDCVSIDIVPVPSDTPPWVEIYSPGNGASYNYDGTPVRVRVDWSAYDDEDMAQVPLSRTRFYLTRGSLPEQDVTSSLITNTSCIPGTSNCFTTYSLDLTPQPGFGTTAVRIRIEADDLTPASPPGEASVTVYLQDLI